MLLDTINRFVTLSNQIGVKGSNTIVKTLMTTLRRSGLSSSQISELSNMRWSSTLVRQYTKNWNGVEKELENQTKTIIELLRQLGSSNTDINDIENYLSLETSVKAKGTSLEEIAELNSGLRNLDLYPGEIERMVTLSRELLEHNLPVKNLTYWISLDHTLVESGFNKEARQCLSELYNRFGGVDEVLTAVRDYTDVKEILTHGMQLVNEVDLLRDEKEQLDYEITRDQAVYNAARSALFAGFDAASLAMISVMSQNLGGPYKVAEAIKKYETLNEMDGEIAAKKTLLDKVTRDTSIKAGHLTALSYSLEEAKEVYGRNSDVRQVVELLVNPRGMVMDKLEVVGLLGKVLDGGVSRLGESDSTFDIADPMWGDLVESIRALSFRLRQFNND